MSTSEYSAAGTAGKWYIQVELYQSAIPRKHGCSLTWKHIYATSLLNVILVQYMENVEILIISKLSLRDNGR